MATPVSGVNTWLTLNSQPLILDPHSDNLAVKATEHVNNVLLITPSAPNDLEIRVDGETLETERFGYWIWRPKGFAGLYDLSVSASDHGIYHTQVRVLPNRISQERYEWMMKEISEFSADLLFQLHAPAGERVSTADSEQLQSPLRTYRLIESLMEELNGALAHIERMPHQSLISQREIQQWYEVTEFAANVMPLSGTAVALPAQNKRLPSIWPQEWQVEHQVLTYDVYENRLLKQFLWRQMLPRLYDLEERAHQEIERRKQNLAIIRINDWEDTESSRIAELEEVVVDCRDMQRQVIGWGSMSFLKQVSLTPQRNVPTQILQKHPAYRRFYQIYLRFQRELKRGLNNEGFLTKLAVRKLSEMYEMWSIFKCVKVLLVYMQEFGYQIVSDEGFFRVDDEMFHFEVDRRLGAAIVLQKGQKRVLIRYEPLYPPKNELPEGLVSTRHYQRTPDLAVELWQDGKPQHVLIFDAKYKAQKEGGKDTFLVDDLQKMDAYYNGIGWKDRHSRMRPSRIVSSAYILYPGEVLEHYSDDPEIGALPLIPGPKQNPSVYKALIDLMKTARIN